jgi:CHAT domain-containing protein/Tfp pilus assembly protein PilF
MLAAAVSASAESELPYPLRIHNEVYSLIAAAEHDSAIALLEPALASSPDDAILNAHWVTACVGLRRLEWGRERLAELRGNSVGAGRLLYTDALFRAFGGEMAEGIAAMKTATDSLRATEDIPWLTICLIDLGKLFNRARDPQSGAATLREAANLAESLGWNQPQIDALDYMATSVYRLGDMDEAIRLQERSIEIAELCGSPTRHRLQNNLGSLYRNIGRFAEAKEMFLTAAAAAGETGNIMLQTQRLIRAATTSMRLGELDEAIQILDTALLVADEHPELPDLRAMTLTQLGRTYRLRGDLPVALSALEDAVGIYEEMTPPPDTLDLIVTLQQLANVLNDMGRLEQALDVHERCRQFPDLPPRALAAIHNNLGNCLADLGDAAAALARYEESLRIAEEGKLFSRMPTYLANIALMNRTLGRYEEALEYFERSRELFSKNRDLVNSLHVQMDLARLHSRLGSLELAEGLLIEVRDRMEEERIHYRLPGCLISLASLQRSAGDADKARANLARALALADSTKSAEALQAGLLLARLDLEAGDFEGARASADAGYERAKRHGFWLHQAEFLSVRGSARWALGSRDAARADLSEAFALADQAHAPAVSFPSALALGRCHREEGRLAEAERFYRHAIDAAEALRRGTGSERERWNVFAKFADPHLELASMLANAGDAAAALELVEMGHARTLVEQLREQGVDVESKAPRELVREKRDILSRTSYVHGLLVERLGSEAEAPTQELLDELQELDRAYDRVEGRLRAELGFGSGAAILSADELDAFRRSLPQGVAFVELASLADGSTLALHGSRDRPTESFRLDGDRRDALEEYSRWLRTPSPRRFDAQAFAHSAHEVYRALIAPILASHSPQQLIFVADGVFHELPLEALLMSPPGDDAAFDLATADYLYRHCDISYAPSLTALAQLDAGTLAREGGLAVLAVADPLYPGSASEDRGESASLELRERKRGYEFGALPFSRQEAEAIREGMPSATVTLVSGAEATEERVKELSSARYDIIHFAAHSWIDEEFPAMTSIVLTLDEDRKEDGFLAAREIYDLRLDVELVVLSACQTAAGRRVRGEGVIALVRPFLVAGAQSVLVSKWAVNDRSTAELMGAFYRAIGSGSGPLEAMRSARDSLLRSDRPAWRLPYHWAPFVLVGAGS